MAALIMAQDMSRVECTRPEDKNNLMAEVKRASGLKRMQVGGCSAGRSSAVLLLA